MRLVLQDRCVDVDVLSDVPLLVSRQESASGQSCESTMAPEEPAEALKVARNWRSCQSTGTSM